MLIGGSAVPFNSSDNTCVAVRSALAARQRDETPPATSTAALLRHASATVYRPTMAFGGDFWSAFELNETPGCLLWATSDSRLGPELALQPVADADGKPARSSSASTFSSEYPHRSEVTKEMKTAHGRPRDGEIVAVRKKKEMDGRKMARVGANHRSVAICGQIGASSLPVRPQGQSVQLVRRAAALVRSEAATRQPRCC